MADTVQKTKSTSKPRKTATKKENVAEPAKLANPFREDVVPVAKATSKPRKTATKTEEVVPAAKARQLSRAEIEQVAYRYWAERGYQHGYALQDWLRAEQELLQMAS